MQLKSFFSKWAQTAGLFLMIGALAWAAKLSVIVATNGRIIDTGAAALLMKVGLLMLALGSTGIGARLGNNRAAWVRVLAIVFSPILVFGTVLLFAFITEPLFQNSGVWYAKQESPIAVAVVVYLAVGYVLFKSSRPVRTAQLALQ